MTTAIYSALTMRPVKRDIAMTGEITLRGRVLQIGGLKEKSMAAYKSGVKKVYIPKANLPDLSEFDKVVLDNIEFVPVESFKEVIVDATDDFIIPKKKYDSLLITKSDSKNSPNIRQ